MSVRVVDRVDGWDQRPFSGGYDTLHDLADEEFSGVVRAGGAELFVTLGAVVDVRRGSIEDFESASGTVFEAPAPALPLLAVMQEADADVRAQYYTEETPITEVDGTLTDGGFTGFLELSENVLSGDYFLVYHGGESMSVAYVGNNDKLVTDDEAFQTADDEVGIYKVRQVDVEPIEIPAADGAEAASAQTATAAATEGGSETTEAAEDDPDADDGDADVDDSGADDAVESGGDDDAADETTAATDAGADADEESGDDATSERDDAVDETGDGSASEPDPATSDDSASTAEADSRSEDADGDTADAGTRSADSAPPSDAEPSTAGRTDPADTADSAGGARREGDTGAGAGGARSAGGQDRSTGASAEPRPGTGGSGHAGTARSSETQQGGSGRSGGTAGDLETRSIPSLDPDQTHVPERSTRQPTAPKPGQGSQSGRGQAAQSTGGAQPAPEPAQQGGQQPGQGGQQPGQGGQQPEQSGEPRDASQAGGAGGQAEAASAPPAETDAPGSGEAGTGESAADAGAVADLEDELADREAEIERLESELASAEGECEDLEADLAAVREERDDLEAEVERLEEELQRLEQEFGAATDAEQRMTPAEAIEGTNLFVEYDSKGKATLSDAHGGSDSREEVAENLRMGVHTEFDERAAAVGGQDFDEFLRSTLHYRFAEWVVGDLLFEIRDTGHADALPDLYEAIPEIRRVEFNGAVDVEYVEDGQEKGGRERFDVIFRHRMGDPLLVANLNDSRDPATGSMMESLVTAAERVGQTEDGLASAFLVTSSFFESEALETVSEATQGGLLSRDSRKSFVNLSRKAGYHLCLVAARDSNFHMEVPEL